ncbi:hypothetical protein BDD12DRAFT_802603 [Trichophaea hybrida]|nr:hypothetical protein BDD12DRAFT_802603 [Trichophaea hybrida]
MTMTSFSENLQPIGMWLPTPIIDALALEFVSAHLYIVKKETRTRDGDVLLSGCVLHSANMDYKININDASTEDKSVKTVPVEFGMGEYEEPPRKSTVVENNARRIQNSRLNPRAPLFIPRPPPANTQANRNQIRHPLPQRPPPPSRPEQCPTWGCRRYEVGGCPCGNGREQYPRRQGRRERRGRHNGPPPPGFTGPPGYAGPPIYAEPPGYGGLPYFHPAPLLTPEGVWAYPYPMPLQPLPPQFFPPLPQLQSSQSVSSQASPHPVFVDPAITMAVHQGRVMMSPSPPPSTASV